MADPITPPGQNQNKTLSADEVTALAAKTAEEKATAAANQAAHAAFTKREKEAEAKRAERAAQYKTEREQELATHGETLAERFTKALDERLTKVTKSMDDRIAALAGTAAKPKDGEQPLAPVDLSKHPEFLALREEQAKGQALLEEQKKALEEQKKATKEAAKIASEERKAREQAETERRSEALVTRAKDAISEHIGVKDPVRVKLAWTVLKTDGRIAYDDGGKGSKLVYIDDDGEEQPIDKGLKKWAKTPEAEAILPPIDPGGSGGSPIRGRRAPPQPTKPEDKMREAVKAGLVKTLIG
jgi:biopolymer transport protein ExbB/TolQ